MPYSNDQQFTAGIDRQVILDAALACQDHWIKEFERKNEEQIAEHALRMTGWFWNRQPIGRAAAEKWHADLAYYYQAGYGARNRAAEARYIADIAEKSSVSDMRLTASDIHLLKKWLD